MIKDLRDWLKEVEGLGELLHVSGEVDWDQEMSALTYMVGKQEKAPALLFDNIQGYPMGTKALWNIFGTSQDRIALTMGLPTGRPLLETVLLARERLSRKLPPVEVDAATAPVNEHIVRGDDIDLYQFPIPKMWPLDGGRYLGTWNVFVTKDPDDGHFNLGTYRQMIHSKNELSVYWSPGKDARIQSDRSFERGEPVEVAAAYGADPLLFLVGSQSFPKTASEYDYAGGIRGEGIEVVKGETTSLLIPAHAEIVVEGIIRPGNERPEGPFGEFQGYYGRPEGNAPVIEVSCVHYREDPILTCALMADYPSSDAWLLFSLVKAARIWDDLDMLGVPGIHGVYSFPANAGGFGMVVVSVEQRYPGHAMQVAALAAQTPGGAYYTKWIVVVDEDVDPTDINQVMWAMGTRCDPATDIDILRNTWSTYLDPTKNPPEERPYGSKALINACKDYRHIKDFARRTRLSRDVYERMVERWDELGLPGSPPDITQFEDANL